MDDYRRASVRHFAISGALVCALLFVVWQIAPGMEVPMAMALSILLAGWGVVALVLWLLRQV